ncbi:hypothetical protein [Bacillus rubiinfantis]|uniref:hypothetical protein n=1 Tax=Bacillus rubiinfantis TaxID=1499680 RepID=UPI0005A96860|nr:hypothetical protein [Bacillus rubiinfantis]
MMVHTFELILITHSDKIISLLKDYSKLNEIQELIAGEIAKIILPLNITGIMEVSISKINEDFFRIYLRIEPQSLIKGKRTIQLLDCSPQSVDKLKLELDAKISEISYMLPSAEGWIVSRIDYAINLTTSYVKQCVELAKRSNDPYRYKDTINLPGSSYRKSKSVVLNFYDKQDHIAKYIDSSSANSYLIEEAKDIFRVEVQCINQNKLNHLRKKYDLPNKATIYNYLSRPKMAKDIILYHYKSVIGTSDFYSLYEAIKLVYTTNWSIRKKENVKKWLQIIAQARNITRARKQFVEGTVIKNTQILVKGSQNTFTNYIKACKEIGLSPITIPRDWGISYIPNPIRSII